MKQAILDLISKYPKHYTRMIGKDKKLTDWLTENSVGCNTMMEKIRVAVYGDSIMCENGARKKITRLTDGFIGCGPASTCKCTRDNISANVSATKAAVTQENQSATNEKRKQSMLAKYGVGFNLQRALVKEKLTAPKIPDNVFALLDNVDWMRSEYVDKKRSLVDIAAELSVYYGTVGDYCRKHGLEVRQYSNESLVEKNIIEYIKTLGDFDVVLHDRTILFGKELDIYIPSKKIAIEVNGLYWHSYNPSVGKSEDRNRHIHKTEQCEKNGISLLHITDWQWKNRNDVIKNILKSKLGVNTKIHARKCDIRDVEQSVYKKFFDDAHLSENTTASGAVGLYLDNVLVSCMSYGKKRFGDRKGIEVIRFATTPGVTVVGGLSKILNNLKTRFGNEISTYCDRDFSNGNSYMKAGFVLKKATGPGYFWTDGTIVVSRYKCQRTNLEKWLPTYDASKSESQNLFDAGYRRYWNSGNLYFELT